MRKIVLLLAGVAYASAQSANASLRFEVASVRIAGEAATGRAFKSQNGPVGLNPLRFSRRSVTLDRLLMSAYGIPHPTQLIGPEWLGGSAYDIEALAPEGSTAEQQLVMLQNLLVERFAMKIRRESRELPAYELVIAKGGPKLKLSDPYSPPLAPFTLGRVLLLSPYDMASLSEQGTMAEFAARLSRFVDRPIADRTELKGEYDVTLRWWWGAQAPPSVTADAAGLVDAPDSGISIFSAIQSQLGLKLDAKRTAVPVWVVDHAEKIPAVN